LNHSLFVIHDFNRQCIPIYYFQSLPLSNPHQSENSPCIYFQIQAKIFLRMVDRNVHWGNDEGRFIEQLLRGVLKGIVIKRRHG